jgi:Cu/Ag efflux protein CusF
MKSILSGVAFAVTLFVSAASFAADPLAISQGTIKKVDKTLGTMTVSHGPLENLGMAGMTMPFKVQDAGWLDKFKAGDKIRFRVEELKTGYTIVRIEAAP